MAPKDDAGIPGVVDTLGEDDSDDSPDEMLPPENNIQSEGRVFQIKYQPILNPNKDNDEGRAALGIKYQPIPTPFGNNTSKNDNNENNHNGLELVKISENMPSDENNIDIRNDNDKDNPLLNYILENQNDNNLENDIKNRKQSDFEIAMELQNQYDNNNIDARNDDLANEIKNRKQSDYELAMELQNQYNNNDNNDAGDNNLENDANNRKKSDIELAWELHNSLNSKASNPNQRPNDNHLNLKKQIDAYIKHEIRENRKYIKWWIFWIFLLMIWSLKLIFSICLLIPIWEEILTNTGAALYGIYGMISSVLVIATLSQFTYSLFLCVTTINGLEFGVFLLMIESFGYQNWGSFAWIVLGVVLFLFVCTGVFMLRLTIVKKEGLKNNFKTNDPEN